MQRLCLMLAALFTAMPLLSQLNENACTDLASLQPHQTKPQAMVGDCFTMEGRRARLRGEYHLAHTKFTRAMAIAKSTHGDQSPRYAGTLADLGTLFYDLRQFAEAEKNLSEALRLLEGHPDTDARDLGTVFNNLGVTLFEQGRLAEAEALYRRAHAQQKAHLGEMAAPVLTVENNLAMMALQQGRTAEAERTLVELWKKVRRWSADTLLEASVTHNLALARVIGRSFGNAAEPCLRSIAIRERELGANHPLLGEVLMVQAAVLEKTGQGREADAVRRQAQSILRSHGLKEGVGFTVDVKQAGFRASGR